MFITFQNDICYPQSYLSQLLLVNFCYLIHVWVCLERIHPAIVLLFKIKTTNKSTVQIS